ncbi:DUF333 domain-containing protein [Apirhabdus apintestini]|uniref:putative hemolysin n=1 Tax=Erwinia sp. HR93 TaxID=3094840 RepID=UPI002ADECBF2|nr:DUF333 domain-containing protein [Erwinia sp. HR93]MEA1064231.1 DUF333 domain-containing protein [Erwinia sp. HR93]WPM84229.1 DUF333 domain-containing protein [Enterobacteriaceae bacterium CA-0114]
MKFIAIALSALAVTACSSQQDQHPAKKIGMPNPASEWCISKGGKLEMVNTPKGTVGYCVLPGGERIEEWALYRRDHSAK